MINKILKSIIYIAITITAQHAAGQLEPYRNQELTAEERAHDLLSRLTLDERNREIMKSYMEAHPTTSSLKN